MKIMCVERLSNGSAKNREQWELRADLKEDAPILEEILPWVSEQVNSAITTPGLWCSQWPRSQAQLLIEQDLNLA